MLQWRSVTKIIVGFYQNRSIVCFFKEKKSCGFLWSPKTFGRYGAAMLLIFQLNILTKHQYFYTLVV
jgi:hypothetical protein